MLWKFSWKAPRGREKQQLVLSRSPTLVTGSRTRTCLINSGYSSPKTQIVSDNRCELKLFVIPMLLFDIHRTNNLMKAFLFFPRICYFLWIYAFVLMSVLSISIYINTSGWCWISFSTDWLPAVFNTVAKSVCLFSSDKNTVIVELARQ